ncbi:MAG TPA: hypothetical protein VFF11_07860 [Candidatus Binatia bacterium]|nr:hypothetical protein [Candidatus Binatia bacterium]
MKTAILFPVLMLALATSGCSWSHHDTGTSRPAAASPAPIITPDLSLAARVVSVNNVGRFVVLSFPATQMPKVGQTLFLYRSGLKVAQVNVTGPKNDNNIVADIVTGDAQVGDSVRDE